MSIITVNGINIGSIMAAGDDPKVEWRDIGSESVATDGTTRLTRQTRKRDVKFKTIPLTQADAYAWTCLFTGEGETWSFDASLYGSKGTGPSTNVGCTVEISTPKFGVGRLNVPATTGVIAYTAAVNSFGSSSKWAVLVWRSTDAGATWTQYVVRSDGAKWVNGTRNDAASTTWLSVASGVVTITNTTGSAVKYDDLVVLPFELMTTWPASLGAAAFSPLPFVDLAGDVVDEQASRRVFAKVSESLVKVAGSIRRKLDVDFKAK